VNEFLTADLLFQLIALIWTKMSRSLLSAVSVCVCVCECISLWPMFNYCSGWMLDGPAGSCRNGRIHQRALASTDTSGPDTLCVGLNVLPSCLYTKNPSIFVNCALLQLARVNCDCLNEDSFHFYTLH